jgi:hypothetical protein
MLRSSLFGDFLEIVIGRTRPCPHADGAVTGLGKGSRWGPSEAFRCWSTNALAHASLWRMEKHTNSVGFYLSP